MKNVLKEEITKIKGLMSINEEDTLGKYMDSTYLKTAEQSGVGEEETEMAVFNTINRD